MKRFERRRFDDEKDVHVKRSGKNHSRRPKNDGIDNDLEIDERYKKDIEYFSKRW
jgi:phage/plasmid-associated DNA primase